MHSEHEEALRAEFTEFVQLEQQAIRAQSHLGAGRGLPAEQYERLFNDQYTIADRWIRGPHAQAWTNLHNCYDAFVAEPEQMRQLAREADDLRNPRWTPMARKDIHQAGPLAELTLRLCQARDHAAAAGEQSERTERGR